MLRRCIVALVAACAAAGDARHHDAYVASLVERCEPPRAGLRAWALRELREASRGPARAAIPRLACALDACFDAPGGPGACALLPLEAFELRLAARAAARAPRTPRRARAVPDDDVDDLFAHPSVAREAPLARAVAFVLRECPPAGYGEAAAAPRPATARRQGVAVVRDRRVLLRDGAVRRLDAVAYGAFEEHALPGDFAGARDALLAADLDVLVFVDAPRDARAAVLAAAGAPRFARSMLPLMLMGALLLLLGVASAARPAHRRVQKPRTRPRGETPLEKSARLDVLAEAELSAALDAPFEWRRTSNDAHAILEVFGCEDWRRPPAYDRPGFEGYPLVDGKPLSIWVGAVAAECKKRGWEGFRDSKGKRKKRKTASNEKVFSDAGLKRHVEAGEDREDGRRTAKDGSAAASDDYRARLMQLQRIYFEKEWKQDGGARGYQTKVEMLKAHRLFCNPQIGTMRCNVCDIDVRKRGGRVFEHYFRVLDDGPIEYYARGFPCCGACNTSIIKDATDLGWDKLESAVAKQAAREWAVSVIDILKGERPASPTNARWRPENTR
ncbi:methyltransferase [Aureococcus anophagefferens]|nr:methyltransferase [Aureococcus anophagefferens]